MRRESNRSSPFYRTSRLVGIKQQMPLWRFWAYILGITVLVLSKFLVAQALSVIPRIWKLPDQFVAYWFGKGPVFLAAMLLILFGIDHVLFPEGALMGARRLDSHRFVRCAGIVTLILGSYLFYQALCGTATAW